MWDSSFETLSVIHLAVKLSLRFGHPIAARLSTIMEKPMAW